MAKIIEIKYNGEIGFKTKIKDVVDFLRIRMTAEEFLAFKNENGISNAKIIFDSYSEIDLIRFNLSNDDGSENKDYNSITPDMLCPEPIIFYVDCSLVSVDLIVNQSNILFNEQFTFESDSGDENKRKFIMSQNAFYNEKFSTLSEKTTETADKGIRKRIPRPRVWIWCKSLCEDGIFSDYSIFDLTPFVNNLNLNSTKTGGNFNINLQPIDGKLSNTDELEISGVWSPDKQQYVTFKQNGRTNFLFKNFIDHEGKQPEIYEVYADERYQGVNTNKIEAPTIEVANGVSNSLIRNEVFFKNLISENDLIFISMDSGEEEENLDIIDDFFVNCSALPDKDWDMIALVDSNSLATEYESTDVSVEVSGRDLMKLLIEDGSYFFAKSYSNPENQSGIFNNVNLQNSGDGVNTTNNRVSDVNPKGINRLITTGIIDMLYNPEARNVHFVMNLLMSRLANIELCHSDLFRFYGNKRTEFSVPFFDTVEDKEQTTEDDHAD